MKSWKGKGKERVGSDKTVRLNLRAPARTQERRHYDEHAFNDGSIYSVELKGRVEARATPSVDRKIRIPAVGFHKRIISARMPKTGKRVTQNTDDALVAALVPLARMLIKSGSGVADMLHAAKLACLEAAIREVVPAGRKINVSRLAVITGLTRKEVAALLQRRIKKTPISPQRNLQQRALRVIQGWTIDPSFHRADGRPADLPVYGEAPSFSLLVKRYGGDVTPISVLRELERMKVVKRAASGNIRLHRKVVTSTPQATQQMAEFVRLFKDFAHTVQQISEPRNPPLFFGFKEARVDSPQQAALFQRAFSKRAASLLEGIEHWLSHQVKPHQNEPAASKAKTRIGLGVYLVQDDD